MEKKSPSKILWIILGIVLLIIIAAPSYYFYNRYQELKKSLANPSSPLTEVNDLVNKVGKLMILPQGETPTIATVSDVSKVKNQLFFAQAKNGDKVLIYSKARKAILYDPFVNKIVEVGPLIIPSPTPTQFIPSPMPSMMPSPTPDLKKISPSPSVSPSINPELLK